jgi:hypothetical protein
MMSENEIKIRENLARLRKMGPKREDFGDEEQYQEALSGFRHRIGPSIRYGESLLRQIEVKAQRDE